MPDRVIRDELLESERWLSLKDNADRLAYVALILRADDYGNFSGERFRLMRLWRDFGITSVELVAKTLAELIDHELIGLYDHENKHFLHIMRFRNMRRYWSRRFPQSPYDEEIRIESKQQDTENLDAGLAQDLRRTSGGVGVGVGVGVESGGISITHQRPKRKASAQAPFVLPDDIPRPQWEAWIESRTKARKTPTDWAKHLAVLRLRDLRENGHHPAAVLAESAFNGWSGLFPPKDKK